MKSRDLVKDLRELSHEELGKKLLDSREELMNLRFRKATSQDMQSSRIKELKKLIARIQTVSSEEVALF